MWKSGLTRCQARYFPKYAPRHPPAGCGVVASRPSIPDTGWLHRGLRTCKLWRIEVVKGLSTHIDPRAHATEPESHGYQCRYYPLPFRVEISFNDQLWLKELLTQQEPVKSSQAMVMNAEIMATGRTSTYVAQVRETVGE